MSQPHASRIVLSQERLATKADPFNPTGGAREWHHNDLIMTDPVLRQKAGVASLDTALVTMFQTNPKKSPY